MRALIQRTTRAEVTVDGELKGEINRGLLIFVCAMKDDSSRNAQKLASKIPKLRIFKDDTGKMNRSLIDIDGEALIVSQFTLAADTKSGNRPGFSEAASPVIGRKLYTEFISALQETGLKTAEGVFGANMQISLVNDGPVTIWLEE